MKITTSDNSGVISILLAASLHRFAAKCRQVSPSFVGRLISASWERSESIAFVRPYFTAKWRGVYPLVFCRLMS